MPLPSLPLPLPLSTAFTLIDLLLPHLVSLSFPPRLPCPPAAEEGLERLQKGLLLVCPMGGRGGRKGRRRRRRSSRRRRRRRRKKRKKVHTRIGRRGGRGGKRGRRGRRGKAAATTDNTPHNLTAAAATAATEMGVQLPLKNEHTAHDAVDFYTSSELQNFLAVLHLVHKPHPKEYCYHLWMTKHA